MCENAVICSILSFKTRVTEAALSFIHDSLMLTFSNKLNQTYTTRLKIAVLCVLTVTCLDVSIAKSESSYDPRIHFLTNSCNARVCSFLITSHQTDIHHVPFHSVNS